FTAGKSARGRREQVPSTLNALSPREEVHVARPHSAPVGTTVASSYSTGTTRGSASSTLAIKDLKTGALPPSGCCASRASRGPRRKTLFYSVEDETTKRSHRLYRHKVGTPASADVLLLEEKDERFGVHVGRTRSGAWLVVEISSHTTSEARVLKADAPEGEWALVAAREQDHEYDVDHRGDLFYIRTNSGGRNFRLVTAPVAAPGRASWKEIVPHRPPTSC
ncbi:MAG: hypothetical protein IPL89_17480, partial [Acidobacteria bacterium]|nr:hypothetical protein [Acidobacteriota bacterium]